MSAPELQEEHIPPERITLALGLSLMVSDEATAQEFNRGRPTFTLLIKGQNLGSLTEQVSALLVDVPALAILTAALEHHTARLEGEHYHLWHAEYRRAQGIVGYRPEEQIARLDIREDR